MQRGHDGYWHREMVQPGEGLRFHSAADGGRDVFVHISAVERAGLSSLNEGQVIDYEVAATAARNRRTISKRVDRASLINSWTAHAAPTAD
jgi:cold shock protein